MIKEGVTENAEMKEERVLVNIIGRIAGNGEEESRKQNFFRADPARKRDTKCMLQVSVTRSPLTGQLIG